MVAKGFPWAAVIKLTGGRFPKTVRHMLRPLHRTNPPQSQIEVVAVAAAEIARRQLRIAERSAH
jgi:hypothetical protein